MRPLYIFMICALLSAGSLYLIVETKYPSIRNHRDYRGIHASKVVFDQIGDLVGHLNDWSNTRYLVLVSKRDARFAFRIWHEIDGVIDFVVRHYPKRSRQQVQKHMDEKREALFSPFVQNALNEVPSAMSIMGPRHKSVVCLISIGSLLEKQNVSNLTGLKVNQINHLPLSQHEMHALEVVHNATLCNVPNWMASKDKNDPFFILGGNIKADQLTLIYSRQARNNVAAFQNPDILMWLMRFRAMNEIHRGYFSPIHNTGLAITDIKNSAPKSLSSSQLISAGQAVAKKSRLFQIVLYREIAKIEQISWQNIPADLLWNEMKYLLSNNDNQDVQDILRDNTDPASSLAMLDELGDPLVEDLLYTAAGIFTVWNTSGAQMIEQGKTSPIASKKQADLFLRTINMMLEQRIYKTNSPEHKLMTLYRDGMKEITAQAVKQVSSSE